MTGVQTCALPILVDWLIVREKDLRAKEYRILFAKVVVGDVVADRVESAPHRGEELLVDGLEAPGCGDLAEVLGDHGGCAVDEVAPAGDELRVVAPHEHLEEVLISYQNRERRFGKISEQLK